MPVDKCIVFVVVVQDGVPLLTHFFQKARIVADHFNAVVQVFF
jgi:hypothetical protein